MKERERKKEGRKEREFWDQLISMIQKKTEDFFSQKKVSLKSLSHFTWTSWRAPSFLSHPNPLLFSFHYNNSNYVQTTKHASSNDSTDMGKLAHLHNNKCRFEPIESLLTFKWYKGVISKVCAYPGWLSVWMCREWSNSQCVSHCAQYSSVQHVQPCWQCFVIGAKREALKVREGSGAEENSNEDSIGCEPLWYYWWRVRKFTESIPVTDLPFSPPHPHLGCRGGCYWAAACLTHWSIMWLRFV